MKLFNLPSLIGLVLSASTLISSTATAKTYPLEYFALRDVTSNVEVSPDGKYLALMKIPGKDGNPIIEVYEAANLDKKPFRMNADPMEITNLGWIDDSNLIFNARQKVRDTIDDFNQGVYRSQIARLDVDKKKIHEFNEVSPGIANLLPKKKGKIILSFNPKNSASRTNFLPRALRPRSYYEFDLKSGSKKLLMQGTAFVAQVQFDSEGYPRTARGFDRNSREQIWYYRNQGEKSWNEIYRQSLDSFEQFNIQGVDDEKPDTIWVTAHNGKNTAGLWEFNVKTKSFGEALYQRNDVDVAGVRFHSNYYEHPDKMVGVVYRKDKTHVEYFDGVEGATYKQLEGLIPEAYELRITSRSRDGQTLTIYNSGPRDPGTYYLLKNGKLSTIGSKQPLLKSKDLADVKYIRYKARDGVTIPAYLTVPKGKPPFPTIVLPHGGPFVGEVVGYDEWGQMLANNGYLVIQPQYRGSRGYGLGFYQSAFLNGGQGGYKMQDDKDDGVTYLIEKGLADPQRVAMFGWSYGGYAALVAASRTPQLYQCVIAGAAVADTLHQVNYYRDRMDGSAKIEQLNMWRDSISPINEVNKVNVPMLIIHGSVDQRVPPIHARKYLAALESANKPYKYVELDGADHFSNTLFYDHQIKLYESMINYLKNECGPGGL